MMATSSFVKRRIDCAFTLGQGSFGDSGSNTITLSRLRAIVNIEMPGGTMPAVATLRIFGMDPSHMAQLSSLKVPNYAVRKNSVTVLAGDDDNGLGTVFTGLITLAWVDANSAPNVVFTVQALAGALGQMKPVPPSSYPGPVNAEIILSSLATAQGYKFENSGVSFTFAGPVYLPGTAMAQIDALRQMVPFEIFLDPVSNTLALWPRGGMRDKPSVLVSPDTGMVGYPIFAQAGGIAVKMIFNRNVVYGGPIHIDSSIANATGDWTVYRLTHDIDSEQPRGDWYTRVECLFPGIQ